jgi:hypothetical protein
MMDKIRTRSESKNTDSSSDEEVLFHLVEVRVRDVGREIESLRSSGLELRVLAQGRTSALLQVFFDGWCEILDLRQIK